jgi:uncharacterized membrane protein
VIATVAVVELLIGGAFFWVGMTLVLPFSGLEVLVLAIAFYHCLLHGMRREVVQVEADRILVRRGRRQVEEERAFQRAWVRVNLVAGSGWYPSRLTLRSHGQELEIGEFLTDEERAEFATQLRCVVQAHEGAR